MDGIAKLLKMNTSSNKQISIGYLGPRFLSQLQIKLLSGITKIAKKNNIVIFHFAGPVPRDTKEFILHTSFLYKLINTKKIKGIICWSSQFYNDDGFFYDIEGFLDRNPGYPAVFIGKPVKNYPTFMIDNFDGIQRIMNHLIHIHRYRKFAFISGPQVHPYAVERHQAYVKVLKSNNIVFDPKLISPPPANWDRSGGAKAIRYFLDDLNLKPKKDIEAIVSVSDVLSIVAIEELQKRKIRVPQDIVVVGFNNKHDSIFSKPTITTIDVNFEGIGKGSMELLLSMLNGEQHSGINNSPTKLLIRQSCGCLYSRIQVKKNSNRITPDKDYNPKKEFIRQLIQQKEKIISQINTKLDFTANISYKKSNTLLTALINSVDRESPQIFLNIVENIFEQKSENEIDMFLWNQYLLELREIILDIVTLSDLRSQVEMLFFYANTLLIQQVHRETLFRLTRLIYYESHTDRVYRSIISAYDLSSLIEILANELPTFFIDAFYFSLFLNPEESIEKASLRLGFNSNGVYKFRDNEAIFNTTQLIPTEYSQKVDNLLYFILPLYIQNTPMGFIIIGISLLSEMNAITYEILSHLISNSLQGARDIEDLKRIQVQLEKKTQEQKRAIIAANEANQAKTRFLRNMSHEIRTPLNCIQGFIEIIENEQDRNRINQYIKIIKNESTKLMELINQLMDLSKIEAGKFQINKTRFNILKTLQSIHSTFSQSARNKGLKYKTNISEDLPEFVIGDSLRLRQVIINLVGNAIKFTKKGEISISASIQKETDKEIVFYFEISDTGIGIPKESQASLFDPFVQLEDSMTRKFGGTGLGTSISKKLVNMMGGEIGLESQLGKGSTFWFTVKCQKCSQEAKSTVLKKVKKLANTQDQILRNAVILLVEDYLPNRKVATIHLKKLGCRIEYAVNGMEAVDMFKHGKYDLILMDIQMPEMDGLTATREIRNLPGGKKIPIIAMTAIAYEDDIKIFKKNDMDDVITKPFKKQNFIETIIYWIIHGRKV